MKHDPATIGDAINNVVDKVSSTLSAKAPAAWQLLVQTQHFNGLYALYAGLACLFLTLVFGGLCFYAACRSEKAEFPYVPIAMVTGFFAIIFMISTAVELGDSRTWLQINCPQCAAATSLVDSVK